MRTETTTRTIYTFDELIEKAKEKARDWWREGALDYNWWQFIYEDADGIGLKISGFDLDRRRHATGEFTFPAVEVAAKTIKEHGEKCETFATATAFLKERKTFMESAEKDEWGELATYELQGELDDIENDFLKSLLEDYAIMLQREHDFHLEDEQVDESIMANCYEFTEDGKVA